MNTTESYIFDPIETFSIPGEPDTGVLVIDRTRNTIWSSRLLQEMFRIPGDTDACRNALQVVDKNLLPRLQDRTAMHQMENLLHGRRSSVLYECRIRTASGDLRPFACSGQRISIPHYPDLIVLRFRDISGEPVPEKLHLPEPSAAAGREKRFRTLAEISRLLDGRGLPPEELFRMTAEMLQDCLAAPGQAYARIVIGEIVYGSPLPETPRKAEAEIAVRGIRVGDIGVAYTGPEEGEPFQKEDFLLLQVVAGMLGRLLDQMQTEETLGRQAALIDLAHDTVTVRDMDDRITFWNRGAEEEYGWTREEVPGQSIHELLQTRFPRPLDSIRTDLLRTGRWEGELVQSRRDGSRLVVASRWALQRGEDGKPVSILEINNNITGRKRAEAEIQKQNNHLAVLNQIISVSASSLSFDELLETSLEKTLDLLKCDVGITYALDTERTRALPRYRRGTPESLHARQRFINVHHWPYNFVFIGGQPRYLEQREELGTLEAGILQDYRVSTLACIPLIAESVVVGALFIGDKEKPAFSPGEKGLLEAIGKEIGAGVLRSLLHKRLEAANREANLYLDIMTHDIRNAENVASLYSDLLVEMLDGQAAEYAEKVRDSIRKGTEIVRHVSTIRKIRQESSPLEPVCLDPVIRDRILDRPNITVASSSNLPEVWADEFLSEVFERLIDNSIQFAGSAAEITVRVEECDDEAVVSVEDTGPGVPDSLKEAIFHRFEREKNQGTGKGFGLYIARMLVERYGGRIWVEDRVEGRPDLGAAFRFTLRIVEADLDRPRYSEEDEITEDDFDA